MTTTQAVDFCGDLGPAVQIVKFALTVIQWVVPIVLIALGSIDLTKAVIAGEEKKIKENQQILIKRVIAAVIVFLVPTIVSVVMNLIGNDQWQSCWNRPMTSIKDYFKTSVK